MHFSHLTTEAEILDLIAHHNAHSEFVVWDTETTSKDPRVAKLIDIQISGYGEDEAVLFGAEFLPLMRQVAKPLVGWHQKYDLIVAYLHGVDLRGNRWLDGTLYHHLVDENAPHDLDSLVQERYGDAYKELFWSKYKSYPAAPFAERLDYGCLDIVYTGRLFNELRAAVSPQSLAEHAHRLAYSLLDTELEGIPVDLAYTVQLGSELQAGILKLEDELRQAGGYHCEAVELGLWAKETEKAWTPNGKKWKTLPKPEFNFASSNQVKSLLYEQLKLPVQISHKTKKPTVDDEALEELELLHPMVAGIRAYRTLDKMKGTFIDGILDRAEGATIYPSLNVNGTKQARISHSDPNMGQMPSDGEWSKIRGIFIPPPGHSIVTADYGQIEVCLAAHFSQDKNLLKIIHEGASKHDITAKELGIERSLAKTLNFAMQYLCSPFKVKQLLGCSDAEALEVWQRYWVAYEGEKKVIDECIALLEAGEDIVSPFGRRRRFPGYARPRWAKPEKGIYDKPMRRSYNSKIQSPAADMMSRAYYLTTEEMGRRKWGRGLFTLHDEGILAPKTEHAEECRDLLVANMLLVGEEIKISVPLKVAASAVLTRWQK